jgi:hypothetical protein
VSAFPPHREVLHPVTPRIHHRHHLDLRHHGVPVGDLATPSLLTGVRVGCPLREVLMIDLSLSSDEKNFITNTSRDAEFTKKILVTSTVTSSGHLAMARSSSSMTLMKKRRRRRRRLCYQTLMYYYYSVGY